MELQTLCCALPSQPLHSSNHRILSSPAFGIRAPFTNQRQRFRFGNASKCLKWVIKEPSLLGLSKFQRLLVHSSDSNLNGGLEVHPKQSSSVPVTTFNGAEPFHGKSGSVSFCGLTHQSVEEGKLESSPFEGKGGSFLWVLAPAAFIASLILPQFFVDNVVEAFLNNVILIDIVTIFSHEVLFYIGLATFLHVTDCVQRPYLQYSSKRWGLITGLRGYLFSAFFTMGLKIIAPLILLFVTWSAIRIAAFVAITPFLVGCVAQIAFEKALDNRGSSCWPLVPVIFEVYRLYQLTKAANFAEKLLFSMKGLPAGPELVERSGALFAMLITFQVLGIVCLWSLMTFLLRLFPSRPVADHY
ncbi:hypothetical protein AAZX31_04G034400 [Glycine max]|uniref:Uncharacterized protein n=1 Tax=Glycine soja TaxID=3848 RepID=A0A445KV04_GLYSO|nr:uncharacterized protein LOC114408668 [Glycine soja]KAG5065231.1 hypothetical protein JHK86_008962 [Glycine max]KAG5033910.1 hypothetical protein JHK87_008820 [Glycine soja]KAH1252406.1 hypothetical protein GmHk_04G009384 [Glycine max]KAH1252407.1 hypothetical protein GmHk_04G009384 [Glycine max]RZC14834.1 hypothetical protein D0Y65_008661 [Glycine soja]